MKGNWLSRRYNEYADQLGLSLFERILQISSVLHLRFPTAHGTARNVWEVFFK